MTEHLSVPSTPPMTSAEFLHAVNITEQALEAVGDLLAALEREAITRYLNDPIFHSRVTVAVKAADRRSFILPGVEAPTRAAAYALILAEREVP